MTGEHDMHGCVRCPLHGAPELLRHSLIGSVLYRCTCWMSRWQRHDHNHCLLPTSLRSCAGLHMFKARSIST